MAEVAGLVLGALPLLISALEHYQDVAEPVKVFFKWRQQLGTFIRELYMGHTSFAQSICLLLKQSVQGSELVEMIDKPGCDLWRRTTLVEDLEQRLGIAYRPCMSTIDEIAEILIAIAGSLNIEGADKVTVLGLQAIVFANPPDPNETSFQSKYHFGRRISLVMDRRTISGLLKKLRKCNSRLYEFLDKADKIHHDVSDSRVKIRFVAPLVRIQGNASRLHKALLRCWCAAHPVHHAGILLEQRLVSRRRAKRRDVPREVDQSFCFGISLLRIPVSVWVNAEFRLDEDLGNSARCVCNTHCSYQQTHASTSGHRHGVSFSIQDATPQLQLQEVTDICSTVEWATHPMVGYRLDSAEVLRGPYEIDTPCTSISNTTTLSDLLIEMRRADFPDRDRYTLAITLASSLLQLGETPWLENPWSKRDILFLRVKENSKDSPDIKHPYLTQGYESTAAGARAVNNQPRCGRNLLSLAILLLEIRFGIPIEGQQQHDDLGPNGEANEATDLTTASRWLRREADKGSLSAAFLQAIKYCLQCYLDPLASFGNPDFSQAVEEKVLEPLDREMKYLFA